MHKTTVRRRGKGVQRDAAQELAATSPCVCFNLRRASRVITQVYDEQFRDVGLRVTQVAILNALRALGPLTVCELATAMATDRTTLTRNLKPLERDGYLGIQAGQDRRLRTVTITRKGTDTCLRALAVWEKLQNRIYRTVGKERIRGLCADMHAVSEEIRKIG